ncbi:hypothetical protein MMC30_001903 [Trapelia coarctata]|nr:hypothetical protein [Trapelia coarctata]
MPFPTVPLPTIPLPKWAAKSRSRPGSTQAILKPLETLDEKDTFGLPSPDDPDPFGVLALEKAGLEIKEAGTKSRPTSDAFEYRPSPTSPIFANFARHSMQSIDSVSRQDSKRDSKRSTMSVDQGTQTADLPGVETIEEVEVPKDASGPAKKATEDLAWIGDEEGEERFGEEPEFYVEERAPTVQIVAQSVPAQSVKSPRATRAKLVTIPKRIPPALPPRSPYRARVDRAINEEMVKDEHDEEYQPSSHYSSPTKSTFEPEEPASPNPWEEVDLMAPASPQTETSATHPRSLLTDDGKESGGSPQTEYSAVCHSVGGDDGKGCKEHAGDLEVKHEEEVQTENHHETQRPELPPRQRPELPPRIPQDPLPDLPAPEHKDSTPAPQEAHTTIENPLPDNEKQVDAEIFHSVPSTPIEMPPQAMKDVEAHFAAPVGLWIS